MIRGARASVAPELETRLGGRFSMRTFDSIAAYFDLRVSADTVRLQAASEGSVVCLIQYGALLLGIIAQRFFQGYLDTGSWKMDGFWGWLMAAVIIGLLAFPAVYRKTFEPDKHWFPQFCVIFTAGMGWQSIVQVTGKALS